MIAMQYQKGSPMLDDYLKINGIKNVTVWRDDDVSKPGWLIVLTGADTTIGLPEYGTSYTRKRDAVAEAKRLSEHCGLPYVRE